MRQRIEKGNKRQTRSMSFREEEEEEHDDPLKQKVFGPWAMGLKQGRNGKVRAQTGNKDVKSRRRETDGG